MQSKNSAVAGERREGLSATSLVVSERAQLGSCAMRRAARRLEIDRDHRLVSRSLTGELSRVLADEADRHLEILLERIEAVLTASRADYQRLNNMRINLRGDRGAHFEDSVLLSAALVTYGHRGNYHGAYPCMDALGSLLGALVGLPGGDAEPFTGESLAEALHRSCEIWTLELGGVVHVFARPGSDADMALAGTATRISRAPARPLRIPLTIV